MSGGLGSRQRRHERRREQRGVTVERTTLGVEHVSVHVLHYGRALCGSVHGLPGYWGPQHRWVSFQHPDVELIATCPTCKAVLAAMPTPGW